MKIINELKTNLLARVSVRECIVLLFVCLKDDLQSCDWFLLLKYSVSIFSRFSLLLFGAD